jgi:hypothetical protein
MVTTNAAADENNEDRRARTRQHLYMTEREMLAVIGSPHFSVPMTVNETRYTFYRGHRSATVITLRFNVFSAQFSHEFMARQVEAQLERFFVINTMLCCCTDYDFVLVNNSGPTRSYYIWTANSNRSAFNETQETTLSFTSPNVHRYCREAMRIDVPSLNINFVNSSCTVDRLLSITLSFIV